MKIHRTHPVELIKEELKARGMTKQELAYRMGIKKKFLCAIIKRPLSITTTLANRLERALNIPSDFWKNLQKQYDDNQSINNPCENKGLQKSRRRVVLYHDS